MGHDRHPARWRLHLHFEHRRPGCAEAKGAGQTLTAEVVTYTLTDTDGSTDTATLTISLTGTDDTPTLTVPDTGGDTKTVDEAGLPTRTGELAGTGEAVDSTPNNDNSEIVSGTFTFTAGDGATVITIDGAGAGGPLTIPLGGPFPTAAIVGSYGSLVVTGVSGGTVSYTYTLTDNVNHSTQTPQDDFTITVDDSDGSTADKVTDTLTIHITDDTPLNFQPDTAVAENTGTDVVTGSLDDDGTLANDGGADSIASLVWNTGAAGTILLDTDGNHVTVGGQDVKLYIQLDGSLVATTDISSAAAKVFTATLDSGASSYTIDFDRALDNGSTSASNFEGAKAGNNQWIGIDPDLVGGKTIDIASASDPNPESTDLLISAFNHTSRAALTVNRDSDDIGAGSGQANGANETTRIDFVQDLTRDPLVDESTAGGYNFDTHIGEKVFSFTMVNPKAHGDTSVLLEAFNTTNETTSKGDVHAIANNTAVELDPASIVVKLGNTVLVEGTDYDVYNSGNGVYVSGIPEGAVIQVQAIGGATFEAVEITNAAGHHIPGAGAGVNFTGADFGIGGFSYGVNDPGDPVAFNLPVTLTDGDGDTSSGTVPVTVYPVGEAPSNLLALNSVTTQGFKTALAPSNDNGSNTNAALLGAVAAAGLVASQDAAAHHNVDHAAMHEARVEARAAEHAQLMSASDRHDAGGHRADHLDRGDGGRHDAVVAKTAVIHDEVLSQHASNDHHQQNAPAALLQGTSAPAHGHEGGHAAVIAAAVAMPSAEQLAAVTGKGGDAQHNEVVGKVLADALQGGEGHGPNLEALINSLPGHGHGPALAALASHADGHVPHGHTAFAGVFSTGHNMLTMDHMAAHHDAPPPHA